MPITTTVNKKLLITENGEQKYLYPTTDAANVKLNNINLSDIINVDNSGIFNILASNNSVTTILSGNPNGTLLWGGRHNW